MQGSDPRKQLLLGPPRLRRQLSLVGLHFWICTGTGSRHRHGLRDASGLLLLLLLLPLAVRPIVDVVERVLFLPPLADSATNESGRQLVAPAVRPAELRRHRVRTDRA